MRATLDTVGPPAVYSEATHFAGHLVVAPRVVPMVVRGEDADDIDALLRGPGHDDTRLRRVDGESPTRTFFYEEVSVIVGQAGDDDNPVCWLRRFDCCHCVGYGVAL